MYWLEIDGVRLNFGPFYRSNSENKTGSVGGISYTSNYYDVPKQLGFADRGDFDVDQKHKVSIVIPKRYYEVDGALHFKFQVSLDSSIDDESMGIDNIVLGYLRDCLAPTTP
jgi:hypothetical protein